jgi:SAM-dependent MidA family methyltransferase
VSLREDQILEVNLDALDWLAGVSRAMQCGWLVTIDYGDLAPLLYAADRAQGTLRSFYRHRLVESPLERIGEQDITASVNFTALIEGGRDGGLETLSYERQTAFLLLHGLVERIAAMHKPDETLDDVKARLAIKNLFVPGGASDNFRVLVQQRLETGG